MAEDVDRALFTLPLRQLSPILESNSGFHIVCVLERQDMSRQPFQAVQDKIKVKIRQQRTAKQIQDYIERLRQQIPVWTIFDEPAEQLLWPRRSPTALVCRCGVAQGSPVNSVNVMFAGGVGWGGQLAFSGCTSGKRFLSVPLVPSAPR